MCAIATGICIFRLAVCPIATWNLTFPIAIEHIAIAIGAEPGPADATQGLKGYTP
jgi:hypothetical protein